jgi:hypothetical protein
MLTWFAYTPSFVDSGVAPGGLGDGLEVCDGAALTVAEVGLGLAGSALVWADVGGAEVAAGSVAGGLQPASSNNANITHVAPVRSGTKQPPLRMVVPLATLDQLSTLPPRTP